VKYIFLGVLLLFSMSTSEVLAGSSSLNTAAAARGKCFITALPTEMVCEDMEDNYHRANSLEVPLPPAV
jgi:hypothetical protein